MGMTVRQGEPQSHQNKGWELFTDRIIQFLNERPEQISTNKAMLTSVTELQKQNDLKGNTEIQSNRREASPVIFMLWGKSAQEKGKIINQDIHHILSSSHPSPLACFKTQFPFMGSKCFSRANKILESQNCTPIDWSIS